MKVAAGYALPSGHGQLWHGREIRAGYARVGVDAIVPRYESLELDVAGPEEETTLGKYWVVSFFGIRNSSCFQARHQGGHPLLRVLAIHHLSTMIGTTTRARVHIDLRLSVSRLRRLRPLTSPRVMASPLLCPLVMPLRRNV
jgi:hypothetical protein